jgi:hypothetical protein
VVAGWRRLRISERIDLVAGLPGVITAVNSRLLANAFHDSECPEMVRGGRLGRLRVQTAAWRIPRQTIHLKLKAITRAPFA